MIVLEVIEDAQEFWKARDSALLFQAPWESSLVARVCSCVFWFAATGTCRLLYTAVYVQ